MAGTAYHTVYLRFGISLQALLNALAYALRARLRSQHSTNRNPGMQERTDATRTFCGMEAENQDGEPQRRSLRPSSLEPPPHLSEHSRNDALVLFPRRS